MPGPDLTFDAEPGLTLAGALRARLEGRSWNDVRRLCTTGKVRVDGAPASDPSRRLAGGERIEVFMRARRTDDAPMPGFRLVFDDPHLVVIEKPAGVPSVPFERQDRGTAMDLVRAAWRRAGRKATVTPLYVVHRLDKETSGLLCFAKTRAAARALHDVFQHHTAERAYLACAHGAVTGGRIESRLVRDRGDGLRGSARPGGPAREGQHAVTDVTVVERFPRATLCRVEPRTGRTHQIRIHLAERGHPIVGDAVYIRDWLRAGRTPLSAHRMLLHATKLALPHPVTGTPLAFSADPPADFVAELNELRR